ncbi:MAG TPA: ABC transporter permease [Candidatus Cybelea sp.]|nr:ABC transporter permease [Candidatus Cybelea sp.]
MTRLFQDVRYGLRMLLRSPGFLLIAVLTLGLGIGATTALFTVVNGVLLDPLPYPKADQLVEVAAKAPPFSESSISYPNFLDWVRENHTFGSLAGYRPSELTLTGSGDALELKTMQVSASFFPLLGVKPLIGRSFAPEEDKRGAAPVVMLSYGLWKTKFGGSPAILGETLMLSGRGYRVIGVVPASFYFCCEATDFRLGDAYTPIGSWDNPDLYQRSDHMGIFAVGRMKPGVTVDRARSDMDRVARDLAAEYPDVDKKEGVWIAPLKERMVQDVEPMLVVLLAAVGFVLLIACANVANLLLARAMGRRREFAIRSVLGASRGRVVRQLLTESLLLSAAGGGLGLLFASWGTQLGLSILPEALPRANDVRMDLSVLIFTLAITVLASILFGLAPALKTSRSDLGTALKEGGRIASSRRHRTQAIFVVAELALAMVLLIGAGLTLRSLAKLWSIRLGFNPQNVETFTVTLPPSKAKETPDEVRAALRQLTAAISSLPGVQSASLTDGAEPMNGDDEWSLWIEGRPKPQSQGEMISALSYIVSPGYWKTMQIQLLRGRFLTEQDDAHSPAVCVIDENFARQYFAEQDPIGQRLNVGDGDQRYEIVGVVGHVNQWGLDSDPTGPVKIQLYTLAEQFPDKWMSSASFYVHDFVARTARPNYPSADAIRGAIENMNSERVAYDFASEDQIVAHTLRSRRFGMILLAAFAAVALVLASIGIYGVMSYVSGERTHEIGIRMALGAQREDVLKIVMADAGRMTLIAVPIGLAAAAILTAQMRGMLFGVSATDPATFAGVAILLSVVALAACYVPARRAMRVDPNVALRCE